MCNGEGVIAIYRAQVNAIASTDFYLYFFFRYFRPAVIKKEISILAYRTIIRFFFFPICVLDLIRRDNELQIEAAMKSAVI